MHTHSRTFSALLVVGLLAACNDPLSVENRNNPDRLRILATPADLEAVTSAVFRVTHNTSIGGHGVWGRSMAGEQVFSNAYAVGWNYLIPRQPIPNRDAGNPDGVFSTLSIAARTAADGLNRLALGRISLGSPAQDARLKAFAWFTLGVSHGNLALIFDSAAVVDPYAELTVIPELWGYREVMTAALANLDSAITWTNAATTATGTNGFPLPITWINGNALTAAQFVQLIRSYKALFRADVARTPEEAATADWDSVLADASNGITADFLITTTTSGSTWSVNYAIGGYGNQSYHLFAGMADTSGGFDTWLQTPLGTKAAFLVVTPDRRYPQGTTRAAQRANSPTTPTGVLYFRNRSTTDIQGPDAYGTSWYEWYRFYTHASTPGGGPYPVFSHNRIDMLQAEALLRAGDIPGAAALIDLYRTRAGLPALAGRITALDQPVPGGTATNPVPGGSSCVPRIPVGTGPEWTGSRCGDIWEAMKWEYRMENMFVGVSAWYLAARRWGDLPEGTALHFPVPAYEMAARQHPFYDLGGVGGRDGKVGKGTYGL